MAFERFGNALRRFLHSPGRVLVVCLIFFGTSLVFDGILWRLWGLHHDHARLSGEITSLHAEIGSLDRQLRQARDPAFIERQARDRLDLVGERDLVFVFPEE